MTITTQNPKIDAQFAKFHAANPHVFEKYRAVARELGRHGVGCELNPEYAKLAKERIGKAERPETYRDDTKVTDAPLFTALGG